MTETKIASADWLLRDGTRIVQFEHEGKKIEIVEEAPSNGNPGLVDVYIVDEFEEFPDDEEER